MKTIDQNSLEIFEVFKEFPEIDIENLQEFPSDSKDQDNPKVLKEDKTSVKDKIQISNDDETTPTHQRREDEKLITEQILEDYKKEMEAVIANLSGKINEMEDVIANLGKINLKANQKIPKAKNNTQPKVKKNDQSGGTSSKCGLCQRLKNLDIKPKDTKHHLTIRGNNEPESCGHLRDMNIKQMAKLFRNYKMCRVCAFRPISDEHQEEKCTYTARVKLAKCRVSDCPLRYFLCDEHIDRNKKQIQNRLEYYKKNNFPVTFSTEDDSGPENDNQQKNVSIQIEPEEAEETNSPGCNWVEDTSSMDESQTEAEEKDSN